MRALTCVAISLICVPAALAAAAEGFPFTAVVESDETPVRSGPGDDFYSTDVLRSGAEVEVYRRDGDEWLGIRPPEGNFSWVAADEVQVREDSDVATVGPQGAIAWIGARVGRVDKHKWQVKLEPGERVQILGDRRYLASMGTRGEAWYKIAAPRGEFRWIHQNAVTRVHGGESPPAAAITAHGSGQIQLSRMDAPDKEAPGEENEQQRTGPEAQSTSPDGFVARKKNGDELSDLTATVSTHKASKAADSSSVSSIEDSLRDLELELSSIVVQDRANWNLTGLIERAESLVERADSALDRGRARLMVEKLSQFEAIRTGTVTAQKPEPSVAGSLLYIPPQQTATSSNVPITPPLDTGTATDAGRSRFEQVAEEGRYDGAGWLLPVHSQLQIAPRFALTDDQGRVIQYVIPAPGRNLHRHLRKQVGIIGQLRSQPGLGAPVLTANNVVELQRHR